MATMGSVYAKAVYELASEGGGVDAVLRQLRSFWESCQSHAGLMAALTGPIVDAKARRAILADLAGPLGVEGLALRLLDMLVGRGRLAGLPELMESLQSLVEASQGVLSGKVRSAVELSSEDLAVLSASLAKRVGSRVRLSQVVDPSLLGGVVATVAGRTFDASLRTQIERFKNELI